MSMTKYNDLTSEIDCLIQFSALAYSRNLTNAAGGNVSIRCKEGILISATGVCLRELHPEDFILVDEEGKTLFSPNSLKPSKELPLHTAIYASRSNVKCVMHLHPTYATVLSVLPDGLPLSTESARTKLQKIPRVPYAPAGSQLLADQTRKVIEEMPEELSAILLENHGIITFGTTIEDAFNTAELVEASAYNIYLKKTLGII